MTTANALRAGLLTVAKRSLAIMTACNNQESTKLYLVMPFLGLLGYDVCDPFEVYPDHCPPGDETGSARTDFAILKDAAPVIAVTCLAAGSDLDNAEPGLANYFNAAPDVRLGILTNGALYAFYTDACVANVMDTAPFLTVDLESVARAGVADEIIEALLTATKDHFAPETIAEAAHIQLVKKRLRSVLVAEVKSPSEDFSRFALERIGVTSAPKDVIERHYLPLVKAALEESLIVPAVEQLRMQSTSEARAQAPLLHPLGQRVATAIRELSIVAYVRRRLSYLADDDALFDAVENVRYRDYIGKLVVYYDRERLGRLFDYIEGADGYDKFIFPDPIGEIVTNNILEIDAALKTIFAARVKELGGLSPHQKLARIA